MKKALLSLLAIAFSLTALASENPIGEKAGYTLNDSSDRSSWIIKSGKADAVVKSFEPNTAFGPGYLLEIKYDMNVRFKGRKQGTIGLVVPAQVFAANFISDLITNHPVSFGSFDMDYHGQGSAKDANDRMYNPCAKTRIFNVDPNYRPTEALGNKIVVLYHETTGFEIENLEINMKVHESLPVLGAVQLDVSGSSAGVNFKAGFDYKP